MPRFIDELRSPKTKIAMPYFVSPNSMDLYTRIAVQTKHLLSLNIPVIVIDNVADYMHFGNKVWSLKNFPNMAPPYRLFWCEYGTKTPASIGILVRYERPSAVLPYPDEEQRVRKRFGDVAWIVCLTLYLNGPEAGPIGPYGGFSAYVDTRAEILGMERTHTLVDKDDQDGYEKELSFLQFVYPVFLAICFMHCKNIIIKDNAVDRPLVKKYKARHGVAPVNYKTLIIEPLKSILRREGRSDEVGLEKAMHICRGHFSDYTQGNGLFGKLHGEFWMPDMVRGTKGKSPKAPQIEVRAPKIGF